jgi:hypothetical protein
MNQEIIEKGIELYLSGFGPVRAVKKELKLKDRTLDDELKRRGYLAQGEINLKQIIAFKHAQDEYIEALNNNQEPSATKIAVKYGLTRDALIRRLKKMGIKIINYQNRPRFNENVFNTIDTEEKAYWLGFIYADGYVGKDCYDFEISLKGSDAGHLEKFNKFIKCTDSERVRISKVKCGDKECERCRWGCNNKTIWTALNNLGVVPRKSLILTFPDISIFKSQDLILHFIRGYFDGDGCISYQNKEHTKMTCSLLGTKNFLEKMQDYIEDIPFKEAKTNANPRSNNNITKEIYYSNLKGYKFLTQIYKNATIYLDRKYERYLEYCRLYEKS